MTYEEFLLMLRVSKRKIRPGSITELKIADKSITVEKITEPAIIEIQSIIQKAVVEEKKDNYSVLKSDFGKLLTMTNADAKTFFLPAVDLDDVGFYVNFARLGTGDVIIKAAGTDTIQDSTAGGTLYNDLAEETFALMRLRIIAAATWMIEYFTGSGWRTS